MMAIFSSKAEFNIPMTDVILCDECPTQTLYFPQNVTDNKLVCQLDSTVSYGLRRAIDRQSIDHRAILYAYSRWNWFSENSETLSIDTYLALSSTMQ